MLAPRKVLWTTPDSAIDRIFELVPLHACDTVVDLGCGDGRVLLRWAELYTESHRARLLEDDGQPRSDNDGDNDGDTLGASRLPTFVGIDVDPGRIQTAKSAWLNAVSTHRIAARIPYQFHCANAVEELDLWRDAATVLYVYLTPRGMRQLRPLLDHRGGDDGQENPSLSTSLQVLSYMNPLPDATLVRRESVLVPHHPDAAWPLYFYEL